MFPKQAANSLVTETSQYFVFFCRSVCSVILAKCLIINDLRLILVILFFIAFLNFTYSARKTFAQFAAEIAIPYPIIEYCLGHSVKTGITINSYVKVKPQQADAAIRRVIEYTEHPEMFEDFINLRSQMQMMMM